MKRTLLTYGGTLLAGLLLGVLLARWWTAPAGVKIVEHESVKTVTVDKPVLVTRDVVRHVADQAQVSRLMAEAATAKTQVQILAETIANLRAQGAGRVRYVDRPVPGATTTVREAHFQDWRLTFDATDGEAAYSLAQRFEALAVAGRDVTGQPTARVRLFEVGPGETRTELTDAKTTIVRATPDTPRWRLSAAVQAGAGYLTGLDSADPRPFALVAVPWLRRGSTRAAEDSTWALLSPAALLTSSRVEPGVLPVSVNLGRLPHNPLGDAWLSPYVGYDVSGKKTRVGAVLTATF